MTRPLAALLSLALTLAAVPAELIGELNTLDAAKIAAEAKAYQYTR
jgi:hypothetical protein